MNRRGPIPFAAKIQRTSTRSAETAFETGTDVPSLKSTKWAMKVLSLTSRSGFDEFIKRHPGFPRIRIGNSYRYDPDSVRKWILQEQAKQMESRTKEHTG